MEATKKEEERAGISAQTSVGSVAASTGGRGVKSCVASIHNSDGTGAGPSSRSATAKHALSRERAVVHTDSDVDSISSIATVEEERLLRSPDEAADSHSVCRNGHRRKPNKEGLKAKAQYKAAVKICERLNSKSDLIKAEAERLAWARDTVQKGREHFAAKK